MSSGFICRPSLDSLLAMSIPSVACRSGGFQARIGPCVPWTPSAIDQLRHPRVVFRVTRTTPDDRHDSGSSRVVLEITTSGRPQRRAHRLSAWSLGGARRVLVCGRVDRQVAACAAIAGRLVSVWPGRGPRCTAGRCPAASPSRLPTSSRRRGHANILKRLLVHTGAFNLGLLMRTLIGVGTPRGLQGRLAAVLTLVVALWTRFGDFSRDRGTPPADHASACTPHQRFQRLPVRASEWAV